MLYVLILLFWWVFSLEARDWTKVCQEALSWGGFHPSSQKEEAPKGSGRTPKESKGCIVDESCDGDFVSSGDFISQTEKKSDEKTRNPEGEVLVFVSFSMPESSLKELSDAAPKHKAVLVMRGLYEDSLVKTAAKLQHMGVTVDIHPELFDTHGIDRVPVFVKMKKGQEIARLSGNVSLDFATSKLRDVS